jgi:hypothetical protein
MRLGLIRSSKPQIIHIYSWGDVWLAPEGIQYHPAGYILIPVISQLN